MKHLFNLFILLTAAIACHAQKYKPALHLIKDHTYNMVSNVTSNIQQTINGQANNFSLNITGTTAFKVLSADDSVYYMEVNYKSLAMRMNLPTGPVNFDSQKSDTTDIMSTILRRIVDKPFTIRLGKNGRVRSVDNVENMISSVLEGFVQIQGPQKEQIKEQFMKSFGATAIKGSIEMATAVFPEKPVVKGDKWNINTLLQSTMTANIATAYQLTAVTVTSYMIHGDGTIITDPQAGYKIISGMPMQYDMKGTMTSDIKLDKATGWVSESKIKQVISGTVSIKDNPKVPGGITFPMSAVNESVTTDR